MKMNLNMLLVVLIGCTQLHASQPAAAAATKAPASDARDADWDFLTDNANPTPKTLWKNALLGVVAQLRLAKIENLKAENQLKDAQAKQLQEELVQARSNANMWSDIAVSKDQSRQSAQAKHDEESAANQKQLADITAVHNGYKKTASQQLAALQEQNLRLQAELERSKIISMQQLNDFQTINDKAHQSAAQWFVQRLNNEAALNLKEAKLKFLRGIAPYINEAARNEMNAIIGRLS